MKKTIAISLSPNTQKDDVVLAIKQLIKPVSWYDFAKTEKLESEFSSYFGKRYKALAVNSGRSALYLVLKGLGITYGDEVIVQALTCVAVPNSIIWNGAKPVYVDVGGDFNIDPKDLDKKITSNTRAIIVQNSFGIPANYDAIKKIIHKKKRKIIIVEDCALSLGAKYKGKKVGTIGDISFFSFGRDKVISSVFGGMILCKNKKIIDIVKDERDKLSYPKPAWLIQQLLHPIIFSLAVPLYNIGFGKLTLGKLIIFVSQRLKLISRAVYKDEEFSRRPKIFPTKMPGALSVLALNQFEKLKKYNMHRKRIAKYYFKNLSKDIFKLPPQKPGSVWVRFPVVSEISTDIYERLKEKGILLGDWYKDCVVPVRDIRSVKYIYGTCPNAEKIRGKILNLPTYPNFSIKQAKYLLEILK
jgi:dTDP-4-amino-4,6-dideoxygalactose transaminase